MRPLASYIAARNWTVAGAADLTNRSTIRWTLHQLVASGVVSVYDAGTEPVWGIGADQHLVAAFYRNTAIHILVDRAIAETALLAAVEDAENSVDGMVSPTTVRDEALSLRELLKFEFLFSARAQFEKELADEVRLIGPGGRHQQGRPRGRRARAPGKGRPAAGAPGVAPVPGRLPHRRRPAGGPGGRIVRRGGVPRRVPRGGQAVGAAAQDRQRRVEVDGTVQDRAAAGPAPRAGGRRSSARTSPSDDATSPTRSPRPSGASTPSRKSPGRGPDQPRSTAAACNSRNAAHAMAPRSCSSPGSAHRA